MVEGVNVRGAALHREEDDALGPRGEVRLARGEGIGCFLRGDRAEGREGEVAESAREGLQGLAAGEGQGVNDWFGKRVMSGNEEGQFR